MPPDHDSADDSGYPAPPPSGLTSPDSPFSGDSGDGWAPAPKGEDLGEAPVFSRKLTVSELKWPSEWHLIALMCAQGYSQRQIASELDYTEGRISIIVNKTEVQERIERIRAENASNLHRRYDIIAPRALDYFEKVIDGKEQANVGQRLTAAQWVLEKKDGKPKQEIDANSGATILQLLQAMDAAKALRAAASGSASGSASAGQGDEKDVTPPPDPLSDWVTANVPEGK